MSSPAAAPCTPSVRELPGTLLALREIGPWLASTLADIGLVGSPAATARVELAVHELCVNIVTHAFGVRDGEPSEHITLTARREGAELIVTTSDAGCEYDPSGYCEPDPSNPTVGGYGLVIVRRIAKSVSYSRAGGLNLWELAFDEGFNSHEQNLSVETP